MNVQIFSTPELASRAVARRIAAAIHRKPTLVLGLPAGRTPVAVYDRLVREFEAARVDFSRVTTFSLDEFVGLGRRDAGSFHAFLRACFFSRVNLPAHAIHSLNGAARDPDRECARYEAGIRRAGGIDLQFVGLGANGHVAFNEPARRLDARTHRTRLLPGTRRANADLFGGDLRAVPREALSMGMGTILAARQIVLLATGRAKADAVAAMLSGHCTTELPASLLQLHPNTEVVLDLEAARVWAESKRRSRSR